MASPRGVAHAQNRAVLEQRHALEKLLDLLPAEHDGQCLGFLGGRDDLGHAPVALQRDLVQEAEGRHGDENRPRRQPPLGGQVDLVRADFLGAQALGGLLEVASELGDLLQVRLLGVERQVADLHVLEHPLPKGGH